MSLRKLLHVSAPRCRPQGVKKSITNISTLVAQCRVGAYTPFYL